MVYFKEVHSPAHCNISSKTSKILEYMPGNHLVVLICDRFMWRMVPQLRLRTEIAHFEDKIGPKAKFEVQMSKMSSKNNQKTLKIFKKWKNIFFEILSRVM